MEQFLKDIISSRNAKDPSNPIADLLYGYYDHYYDSHSERCLIIPEILHLPVEQRSDGIIEAIDLYLSTGVSLNEVQSGFFPLMPPVQFADSEMVRYLIQQGADCKKWIPEDEKLEPWEDNWYLEDIDIQATYDIYEPNWAEYQKELLKTALVIARDGGIIKFAGRCLDIADGYVDLNFLREKI